MMAFLYFHLLLSIVALLSLPVQGEGDENRIRKLGFDSQRVRNLEGEGTHSANMPVIVTVIDSTTNLEELCYTFQSLIHIQGFLDAPVLAFHGLHLSDEQLDFLQSCTVRPTTFVDITFFYSVFPEGFVPTPGVNYDMRQSEHFFITDLWQLPHMEAHDVIMRITDTTCFTMDNYDLPDFPSGTLPPGLTRNNLMYQSQRVPGFHVQAPRFYRKLFDSVFGFISSNNISPKNPELWSEAVISNENYGSLPMVNNAFEIIRKEFMLRSDVQAYHNFITDVHSDEFFNMYWEAEAIRFLSISIFGGDKETYLAPVPGYLEKDFLKGKHYSGVCRGDPVSVE
mmetsp:Transcript_27588/g.32189  ORF Transcript_27588/g.32189 Transcript_27588/m.32189 type:complete len:339 (-) Transcript_27588:132-1148(-)